MAVARKKTNSIELVKTTIEDDGGQEVNVTIRRGVFEVGHEEKIAEIVADFDVIQQRVEFLKKKAVEAETEQEHKRAKKQYTNYLKQRDDIMEAVDGALIIILAEWDMALTQEDEDAKNFVPLTPEGLKTLDAAVRLDIFNKVSVKARRYSEEKKDALSVNSNGDSPTLKEPKEVSQPSLPESNLQSDMGSGLTQ